MPIPKAVKALERACAIAGGQAQLAALIGKKQGQIYFWLRRAKKGVPGETVLAIEKATGVPRHDLRPDLYPAEAQVS